MKRSLTAAPSSQARGTTRGNIKLLPLAFFILKLTQYIFSFKFRTINLISIRSKAPGTPNIPTKIEVNKFNPI